MISKKLLFFFITCLLIVSCKEDITTPKIEKKELPRTAREYYKSTFPENDLGFQQWELAFQKAKKDSLRVILPYAESGVFTNQLPIASSFIVQLRAGENLQAQVDKQQDSALVFLDLFQKSDSTSLAWKHIESTLLHSNTLSYKVTAYGFYKVVMQPAIETTGTFQLQLYTQPIYQFPIAGLGNSAVKSFWAANRGEGKRTHEGIDIFAPKGTPVIALTDGKITSTEDGELGGKQISLKDQQLGTTLYYAHLDTVLTQTNAIVKEGDTIGLVGNTGNAKDLEPHLHFGVFLPELGPVDPYPYVKQTEISTISLQNEITKAVVTSKETNLYQGPSIALKVTGTVRQKDTLLILGKKDIWFRAMTKSGQTGFVEASSVSATLSN